MIKLVIYIAFIYVIVEFFDYLTGIISAAARGVYTSHAAKIGAAKKALVTLGTIGMVIISVLLVRLCDTLGYPIPDEIASVSGLYIVKAIITEFSSIRENLGGLNNE